MIEHESEQSVVEEQEMIDAHTADARAMKGSAADVAELAADLADLASQL